MTIDKVKLITLIMASFFIFSVGCTNKGSGSKDQKTSEKSNAQKALYQCPMHPQITSDKPGQTCPICGMNLVLVESEDEEEAEENVKPVTEDHTGHDHAKQADDSWEDLSDKKGENKITKGTEHKPKSNEKVASQKLSTHAPFKLSMKKRQMIGVKKQKVKRKVLFKKVKAAGSIAYDPELFTARNEYQEALKQYLRQKNSPIAEIKQSARETLRAAKIRLKVLGLSDSQIKAINPYKNLSEDLLIVDENKKPLVYAEVYESDLPFIKPGQSAEVSASFLEGETVPGKVQSVDRIINRETRTAKVRILLNKTSVQVRPDSYVDVVIYSPVGEHLAVPFNAILDTGLQAIVFVAKENGKFEPRNVLVALRAGNDVAIGAGLKEGEEIVTSANFLIDSESRLKAVIRGATGGSGHAH